MKMSKKIVSLLFALILTLTMAGIAAYAATPNGGFKVVSSASEVKPGDTVTVTVTASEDLTAVGGLDFDLKYNADALSYPDFNALEGDYLDVTLNDVEDGLIKFTSSAVDLRKGDNIPADAVLLTVSFTVKDGASGDISPEVVVKNYFDLYGDDYDYSLVQVKINVACDHVWDAGVETVAATCTEKGVMTYTCTKCEKTKTEDIEALDHNFAKYESDGNATCTEDGTKTAFCANGCGAKDTVPDTGSKLGHKFTSYTSNNDATCTEDGTKTAVCANGCGTKDTVPDTGSKLGHKFGDWTSVDEMNHKRVCQNDSTHVETESHTYGEWNTTVEPTETTEGSKERVCSVCKHVNTEVIPTLDHKHVPALHQGTAPDCTNPGVEDYYTCACGKAFVDKECAYEITDLEAWMSEGGNGYIEPLGHGETEVIGAKEPTCTEDGFTGDVYCTVCGDLLEEGTLIDAKDHEYENGKCIYCGEDDPNPVETEPEETEPEETEPEETEPEETEPEETEPKETEPAETDPTSPKTGESTSILSWILLLAASGAALTGTVLYSKKRK